MLKSAKASSVWHVAQNQWSQFEESTSMMLTSFVICVGLCSAKAETKYQSPCRDVFPYLF